MTTTFHVGQRVTLTDRAISYGLQGRARSPHGTVKSLHRRAAGLYLKVQRDGLRGSDLYWAEFWKPRKES